MLTEQITQISINILENSGYAGASFLMALESMIAPVPSEAVMPFVGFMVADGRWDPVTAIWTTSLGSIIGSWISYIMGYYGGKPLILKVGRYLLLNVHDLEITEKFFHSRNSYWALFICRFIPVVRHFISIPAGIGKMPFWKFTIITLMGATLWNSFLLYCGMVLRDNWSHLQKYSHTADIVIVLAGFIAVAWFLRHRLNQIKRKKQIAG